MSIPYPSPDGNRAPDSGIYGILNTVTGLIYVGSAVSMSTRQTRHLWELRTGQHSNTHLQRAYAKYGEAAFVWGCLEALPRDQLQAREAYWIEALQAADPNYGYNLFGAECGRFAHSAETRAKMRASSRHQPHTPAMRAHLSEAAKTRLAACPMTAEHRAKLSAAKAGKKPPPKSPETRARLSEAARAQHARHRAARSAYKQSTFEDFE